MSCHYRPSLPQNNNTPGNKILGAILSLLGTLLAIVGFFNLFDQSLPGLIFSVIVMLFGLRVIVLWLSVNQQLSLSSTFGYATDPSTHHGKSRVPQVMIQARPPAVPSQSAYYPSHNQQSFTVPATYSYPAIQPVYTSSHQYIQTSAISVRKQRKPQGFTTSFPYIPIDQDPIFELDRSDADERCFLLPKEGEPLVECQDRYALHTKKRCYAVADGVTGSFVPGPWARIIARSFVERGRLFANKDEFQYWLETCCRAWQAWIQNRWVPTMNALRDRNGDTPGDWSHDIRQGAQTTLIGCSLFPSTQSQDSTLVNIFAIGDGEFFLFSPRANGAWEMVEAFPFTDPHEFGSRPDTLVTVPRFDLLERAWMQRKTKIIRALPGDRIVLATDTLAKWLLIQVQHKTDSWVPLLTCTSEDEFKQRMRQELHSNRIEDDDLTILIIPISLLRGKRSV